MGVALLSLGPSCSLMSLGTTVPGRVGDMEVVAASKALESRLNFDHKYLWP